MTKGRIDPRRRRSGQDSPPRNIRRSSPRLHVSVERILERRGPGSVRPWTISNDASDAADAECIDTTVPTPTPPPVSLSAIELPVAPSEFPSRAAAGKRRVRLLFIAMAFLCALSIHRLAGMPSVDVPSVRGLLPSFTSVAKSDIAPPPVRPAIAAEARADAGVRRDGHQSIRGGVLFVPKSFSSVDGEYDLLLHFHGNTKVVLESVEVAEVNTIVAIVNLGIGSGIYQDAYAVPGTYEALLADIDRAVTARGLKHAKLRRVALSSWSAGYGALSTILELRKGTDPLDALLVLDGIHCGWLDGPQHELNDLQLASFRKAAQRAAKNELLFTITHSEIDPMTYASAQATAGYLIQAVDGERKLADPASKPPHLHLESVVGAVSKKLEKTMEPTTEARVGEFHVRGFRGETPEHHMAHLFQMSSTVLPELAKRWSRGTIANESATR